MAGEKGIGSQIATGAAWMVGMRMLIRFTGIISTIILARILVPEDFGLIAMAMLLVAFLEAVSELSFDVVLIQNQKATRAHYNTVWTMQLLRGAGGAILLIALAEPGAWFFNEPRLAEIIYWLALGSLIEGATNIGIVDFRKKMEFHKDFTFLVAVKLISFFATIAAAVILRSYWALIIGMMTNQIARFLLSYVMSPFRPRLTLIHWREIFSFSKWLLVNNILQFLRRRFDSLLIGKILGPATLGLYTIAHEISSLAASELVAPIMRAVLPGFSKLADDEAALKRALMDGSAIIQTICLPVVAGIGLTAHLSIPLLLGNDWAGAVPLIQILTIHNIFYVAGTNLSPVLIAKGRPDLLGKLSIFANVLTLPAIAIGTIMWGGVGTAAMLSLSTFVIVIVNITVVLRLVNLCWMRWISAQWRPWLATLSMAGAVFGFEFIDFGAYGLLGHIAVLAATCLVGAVTFVSVQSLLWFLCGRPSGAELYILKMVNSRLPFSPIQRIVDKQPD